MLDTIDIKVIGIVGIVIILIIGYLVYVMYQDLVFVKKEVAVIKAGENNFEQDNESWCSSNENVEDDEDEDIEEENELDRHLASFMNQQIHEQEHQEYFQQQQEIPVIQELPEPMEEVEVLSTPTIKKKVQRKKKTVEIVEPQQEEVEE
jgi:hypothetical protein